MSLWRSCDDIIAGSSNGRMRLSESRHFGSNPNPAAMKDLKEFSGKLEKIDPGLLIDKDKKDDIKSFFLVLGLIYNDIKGLIFFQKFIKDNYRKPDIDEVSVHMGEYSGLIIQINKLLIATVGEFFIFIEKNRSVLNHQYFLSLIKKLDSQNISDWNNLVRPDDNKSLILSKIGKLRSNLTFHYDHSLTELRSGFIRSFFSDRKKLTQHKHAYFSLGDTMENTRMYYSDAALDDYICSLLDTNDKTSISIAIDRMNHTIYGLLSVYIKSISKR